MCCFHCNRAWKGATGSEPAISGKDDAAAHDPQAAAIEWWGAVQRDAGQRSAGNIAEGHCGLGGGFHPHAFGLGIGHQGIAAAGAAITATAEAAER